MTIHDPTLLPDDLPVPVDDGACDHLPGMALPAVALPATDGGMVDLSQPGAGPAIVFAFPRTGRPGVATPTGWDDIPGARGCTPESCGFRDHYAELADLGIRVYGLSTQDTEYQREMVGRLALPFAVLSDAGLAFTRALKLPTFTVDGMVLIRRLTLVVVDGRIDHVFYPVFPPDEHAAKVVGWLAERRRERAP
ncbi:MAG: peroxiredoxin [Alphaproteobacteria bacterium]